MIITLAIRLPAKYWVTVCAHFRIFVSAGGQNRPGRGG